MGLCALSSYTARSGSLCGTYGTMSVWAFAVMFLAQSGGIRRGTEDRRQRQLYSELAWELSAEQEARECTLYNTDFGPGQPPL